MEELVIRKARVGDIPAIVEACVTSTTKGETEGFAAPEWSTYSYVEQLKKVWVTGNKLKDGCEVVVAEKNDKVVGFIVYSL